LAQGVVLAVDGELEVCADPLGQRAPSAEVLDAATGVPVKLSSYWRSGSCVVEFGSIT